MQLTENFTLEELIHSDAAIVEGIDNSIPEDEKEEVIANGKALCENVLQKIRSEIKMPIDSVSGYRCEKLNEFVGGEEKSQHRRLEACDIVTKAMTIENLYNTIRSMAKEKKLEVDQCIYETRNSGWVHVSFTTKRKNRNQFMRAVFVNGKWKYYEFPL